MGGRTGAGSGYTGRVNGSGAPQADQSEFYEAHNSADFYELL